MAEFAAALDGLPRSAREAFELVIWSGLTYEQAALALNSPIGTVKSRVARARERLRASLDEGGSDEMEES